MAHVPFMPVHTDTMTHVDNEALHPFGGIDKEMALLAAFN